MSSRQTKDLDAAGKSTLHIIIFYEHLAREYPLCKRIKEVLDAHGSADVDVRLFSINFEWRKALGYAKRNGIDAIVVPWLRFQRDEVYVHPLLALNPNLAIVNLDHEQIAAPLMQYMQMPESDFAKREAIHTAWAESFAQRLREAGVPDSYIEVTGNGRLDTIVEYDFAHSAVPSRKELAEQYGLDPEKRWLLFAETRSGALNYNSDFHSFLLQRGLTEEQIETLTKNQVGSLRAFIEEANNLPESVFASYEFIYRMHPGQTAEYELAAPIRTISDYPIDVWLRNVQLYMTWNSTSAFEADLAGVPVVLHKPTSIPSEYEMEGVSDYPSIRHLGEIVDLDTHALHRDQQERRIYERYYGVVDGRSTERIARVVMDWARRGMAHEIEPHANTLWGLRLSLFEKLSYLDVKLGILEQIRYPRSTYKWRKDIPYYKDNLAAYES